MRRTFQLRAGVWVLLACGATALAACDELTGSGHVLRVQAAAGEAQTDTVGAVLAQALVAEIKDRWGRPVAGRTIEFRVLSGGGSLQQETVTADWQGRAQVQWTLGTRVGEVQQVEARVAQASGGSVPDTFTATVRPGAAVRIRPVSPLRLTGVRGRPLADSVTVRVFDRFDNLAAGGRVEWTAGVQPPVLSQAGVDGTARTRWMLSREEGEQTLRARVPDGGEVGDSTSVTFIATGSPPPLVVVIDRPDATFTGDTVTVVADTRASIDAVAGVTATMDGRSTALRLEGDLWHGTLVLSGLVPGPKVLMAVAVDAVGNADTARLGIEYDPPPVLTLEEPANGPVVGSYRIKASCHDVEPCAFTVSRDGEIIARAEGSFERSFTLPSPHESVALLRLRTEDARGRVVTVQRRLYAISEPRWTLVMRLPDPPAGEVIDMDATRLLLHNGAMVTRATGALTQLFPEGSLTNGFLGPHGAIVTLRDTLWEWRSGALIRGRHAYSPLRVDGRWALWQEAFPQAFRYEVGTVARDLQTGTTQIFDLLPFTQAATGDRVDVGPNGDVVVWHRGQRQVARYRNGVRTVLPAVSSARYVRTDGNLIVYISPYYDGGTEEELRVIDAAGADRMIGSPARSLSYGFVVRNGWIAYRRGAGEASQVWIVHPDGTQQQLDGDRIEGLSEGGKVVIGAGAGRRDVFVPGRGVTTVGGPASATTFWVGEELYASWGGGLFRIDY